MKKKILYLLIFSMILLGFNNDVITAEEKVTIDDPKIVGADTGSEGQDNNALAGGNTGKGQGACPNGLCLWNNSNEMAVEVKMVYVANNGMQEYHTEVWTNNKAANGTVTSNGNVMVYKDFLPSGGDDYLAMANAVDAFFLSNGGANAMTWYNQYANTSLETQDSNALNPATVGTRIISTPVLSTLDHGLYGHVTVKEIAQRYNELTNKSRFAAVIKLFMTEYTDVGIASMTTAQLAAMSNDMLAFLALNPFNGLGYNIIDFMKLLGLKFPNNVRKPQPSCPGGSMSLSNPSANCDDAIGGLTYSYSYTASGGSQGNVHRQYGIDQNAPGTGAYCKLFCQEYGTAVLPGALADSVQLGSYIVWPTSSTNTTNKFPDANNYPLKFSGKKSCKLVLMPDHNNFPGNGCLQDPVAEYMCIYDASKVSGSKYVCSRSTGNSIKYVGLTARDYAGVNYEKVRIANNNYFNEPSYCGNEKYGTESLKNNGKAGRSSYQLYKVDETAQYYNSNSYGIDNYSKYNKLIQNIETAARNAQTNCGKVTQGVLDTANSNRKCQVCTHYDNAGNCQYTSFQLCDDVVAAKELVQVCTDADTAYQEAVDATKYIENSIATCRSYITDFNYARNILNEIGLCGNFSASGDDYYHFTSKASISYKNGDYSVDGSLIKEESASIGCSGQCGGLSFKEKPDYTTFYTMDTPSILAGKVSQIENRTIVFTAETDVYGANSKYSYINKKKNEYSKSKLDSNYLEINTLSGELAKVLPTDYNIDIIDSSNNAIKYTMSLVDVTFGENNRFNVTNSGDYVCKYEMAKKNDGCVCPQDSKMPGKDLMGYVIEEPISCADAQIKYCDNNDEKKSDKPLFCPDMKTPLTGCLNTGIGYQACVDLVCPGEYKCKNTNGLRTGMDITDCVQTKRAQGLSLDQALNYCDSVVCPIGKTIIYRTIKLENPFPSMDADNTITQKNLKVHMFNNNVKGRYPGANWNGILTVYNKIRNNRSGRTEKNADGIVNNNSATTGTTIYQTKEPLYTFVLNGVTIKSIRDYNDKQTEGYNDFKLSCNKNNSAACISSFVHDARYGLVSGKCVDVDNRSGSFYTCMNN